MNFVIILYNFVFELLIVLNNACVLIYIILMLQNYNVSKEKIILILNLIVNEKFNIQSYMRITAIR